MIELASIPGGLVLRVVEQTEEVRSLSPSGSSFFGEPENALEDGLRGLAVLLFSRHVKPHGENLTGLRAAEGHGLPLCDISVAVAKALYVRIE